MPCPSCTDARACKTRTDPTNPGLDAELAQSTLNLFPAASRTPFGDEVDAAEKYHGGNRAYQIGDSIPELPVGAIPFELLES